MFLGYANVSDFGSILNTVIYIQRQLKWIHSLFVLLHFREITLTIQKNNKHRFFFFCIWKQFGIGWKWEGFQEILRQRSPLQTRRSLP